MLSKSGGVAVRPVASARSAMKRSPAFHPSPSASARRVPSRASGASSSGASPSPIPSAISGRAASSAARVVVVTSKVYARRVRTLWHTFIRPQLEAGKLSLPRCAALAQEIKATLKEAIQQGGSTLRDFVNSDGQPGYFQQHYWVYGRTGEPCRRCGTSVKQIRQGQRSSFFCPRCQK